MYKKVILISVLMICLCYSGPSFAQIEDDAYLWALNVGWAPVTNKISTNSLNGWSGGTTLEKMLSNSNWAIGFNLTFIGASDEYKIQDVHVAQSFEGVGLYIGFKHYVRSLGSWVPYLGLAAGVNFSDRYTTSTGFYTIEGENVYIGSEKLNSFALAVPLGLNWFVSQKVYLGLNFTAVWADKTFYKSNVNSVLNLALGFHID
jgi:hypothetical protein